MKGQLAVAQGHVVGGHALKAAQVLGPGLIGNLLHKALRVAHAVQQLPGQRALAQAAAPAQLHQLAECISPGRVDFVLDGHHHPALFGLAVRRRREGA